MIFKGFKFGMLLQIAIGPIAIFVFNVANQSDMLQGLIATIGVTLTDSFFIAVAILGLTGFLKNERIKKVFIYGGALIVALFGIHIILSSIGISLIPTLSLTYTKQNVFIYAIVLTGANPLTILFWAGVFSTHLSSKSYTRKNMILFGFGAALSTLVSLTIIAYIGTLTKAFLNEQMNQILNIGVGVVLLFFAFRTLYNTIKESKTIDCSIQ